MQRHYRRIFTAIYRLHKINSSRHKNIMFLKSGITMLIHNKDDIEFVTEFPCLLGHPVDLVVILPLGSGSVDLHIFL